MPMKRIFRIVLTAFVVLMAFSCSRQGRVIPSHKMARIYADMLVRDQWLLNNSDWFGRADTSLVYEPILRKYGYTKMDYVHSVAHYMENPEDLGKIFGETKDIIDAHIKELMAESRAKARLDSILRAIEASPHRRAPLYLDMDRDSIRLDTVAVDIDTNGILVWKRILLDTLYKGPQMVIRSERDSIARADSVRAAKADSLEKLKLSRPIKINVPPKRFPKPERPVPPSLKLRINEKNIS